LQQLFTQQPQLWHDFHNKSEENEQSYPEESIPRNRVIQELDKVRTKRPINVVDMGCGRAQISAHFNNDARFNFINYDHVACNNTVTVCDIANTPLEEDSVQRCVLSMALWGTNCKAYITEAYRILDSDGKLILVEPTKRWSEKDEQGNIIDDKESSELKKVLVSNGFKIDKEQIDKFSLFICSKLQL
jgi:ribosomal RNA-processing protein 8